MTNEEAMNTFKEWIKHDKKMEYADRLENIEIYNMAIKALEQEPCEDCVSRADVKEQMIKYGFTAPDMTVTEFVEECLQPVTPQPKIGRWIKSRDRYGNNHFTCPFCEHDIATKYAGTWEDNYCSNCGARLESERMK